jgi:hypothetical protein
MAKKSMTAFEKAFAGARAKADSRFAFNGKVYNTNRKDNAPLKQTDYSRDDERQASGAGARKSGPRRPSFDPNEDQSITPMSGMPDDTMSEMLEGAKSYLPAGLATAAGVGATALGLRKLAAKKAADVAASLSRTSPTPDMKRAIRSAGRHNEEHELVTDALRKKANAAKEDLAKRTYGNPNSIPRVNRQPAIPASVSAKTPRSKEQIRDDNDMYDAKQRMESEGGRAMKRGGKVAAYAKGGAVSSRGDGVAQRGKTRCKFV